MPSKPKKKGVERKMQQISAYFRKEKESAVCPCSDRERRRGGRACAARERQKRKRRGTERGPVVFVFVKGEEEAVLHMPVIKGDRAEKCVKKRGMGVVWGGKVPFPLLLLPGKKRG